MNQVEETVQALETFNDEYGDRVAYVAASLIQKLYGQLLNQGFVGADAIKIVATMAQNFKYGG